MGAAVGDIDNDGCVDLYVTKLGPNQLLRNNCNGTFTDVTAASRTADPGWSVSAAFVDIDRDGWLDLFVGQYLNYSIAANVVCYSVSGQRDYCPPNVYRARPSHLFRNNRDGTFSDITAAAGMAAEFGPALGVATADFNRDGWIDIYVANDGAPNQLWINQRNRTFRNTALLAGAAVSAEGRLKASMGVDAGDFDEDGDEDVFVGELTGQGADLYVNDGSGVFVEGSAHAGVRLRTLPFTAFGTAWLDADNDGDTDIVVASDNGPVRVLINAIGSRSHWVGLRLVTGRRARRARMIATDEGPRSGDAPGRMQLRLGQRSACSSASAPRAFGEGPGVLARRRQRGVVQPAAESVHHARGEHRHHYPTPRSRPVEPRGTPEGGLARRFDCHTPDRAGQVERRSDHRAEAEHDQLAVCRPEPCGRTLDDAQALTVDVIDGRQVDYHGAAVAAAVARRTGQAREPGRQTSRCTRALRGAG